MSPFKELNIPLKFFINYNQLESEYDAIQSQYHPDLHRHDPDQFDLMKEKLVTINHAFHILKNPVSRLSYFFSQQEITPETKTKIFTKQWHIMEEINDKNSMDIIKNVYQQIAQALIEYNQEALQEAHFILNGLHNYLEKSNMNITYYDKILCPLFYDDNK